VRRNKTDRTDAAGLLEADRCAQIDAVPIKSPEQQGVQALHRIREQLKAQRTATSICCAACCVNLASSFLWVPPKVRPRFCQRSKMAKTNFR
jgi:hypothetical protein